MKSVEFAPAARAELEVAIDRYELQRPGRGWRFYAAVESRPDRACIEQFGLDIAAPLASGSRACLARAAGGRRTGFGAKMMPMKLQNIAPITELKRDAASLIERASEQRSPIVITQNGRATAVLQDVESFEQDRRAFALLRLALQGDADIAEGRVVSRAEYKKRLASLIKARQAR